MTTASVSPHGPLHPYSLRPPSTARTGPDPLRVTAIAGAIALNLAVLLVLMRPMQLAPSLQDLVQPERFRIIDVLPPTPPPPPPPELIAETPRPPAPTAQARPVTPVSPAPPVSSERTSPLDVVAEPAPPQPGPPAPVVSPDPAPAVSPPGPLTGANLAMREAPRPSYPREALRDGREGTVRLLVLVGTDGRPRDVRVERSSGHRDLDQAARQQVLRRWLFHPAMHQGQAVEASGFVEVAFALQ